MFWNIPFRGDMQKYPYKTRIKQRQQLNTAKKAEQAKKILDEV